MDAKRGAGATVRCAGERCKTVRPADNQAPDAAAADAALLFFDFFVLEAFVPDASAGALAAAVAAGAEAAAAWDTALLFFDFLVADAAAGAAGVAMAGVVAAGAAVVAAAVDLAAVVLDVVLDFVAALVPLGAADEPLMVRPAASRLVTDLVPMPFTRVARSSASLNGPFLVRSSMIAFA